MVSKVMGVLDAVDSSRRDSKRWKGVRKRAWGRWVCEIRLPRSRERIWLGSYATAEEAAHAYDAASLCLRGSAASLNFPCSSMAPALLLKESNSHQLPLSREAIQSIAATAAAQCRKKQHPHVATAPDISPSSPGLMPLSAVHAKACTMEARPVDSPDLSAPCIPASSARTLHWASKAMATHLQTKTQIAVRETGMNAEELQVQANSGPVQQSSGADGSQAMPTGAEDDQCLFSILKELVALPRIFNAY